MDMRPRAAAVYRSEYIFSVKIGDFAVVVAVHLCRNAVSD